MNPAHLICPNTINPADCNDDSPSKSQVKRDMHTLLDLGKQLIDLPVGKLKQLPLEEKLFEAIKLAQRTNAREAKRRQVHYVGKLMRTAPAAAIRALLDLRANGSRAETLTMHRLQILREQLLIDDSALTRLLAIYPMMDIQALRAQIRGARKEANTNTRLLSDQAPKKKNYRALFQTLKALHAAQNFVSASDQNG